MLGWERPAHASSLSPDAGVLAGGGIAGHTQHDRAGVAARVLGALATRVGAGIAAEIGAMVVTEQVDALRMCAADPVDYLLKPRFLASRVRISSWIPSAK